MTRCGEGNIPGRPQHKGALRASTGWNLTEEELEKCTISESRDAFLPHSLPSDGTEESLHPISGNVSLCPSQDTLGGQFDASQALVGELSQFNLWDRLLKPAEVAALADCSSSALGNIAPWTDQDVDVYGGATKESLDPCHAAQRSNPSSSKQ